MQSDIVCIIQLFWKSKGLQSIPLLIGQNHAVCVSKKYGEFWRKKRFLLVTWVLIWNILLTKHLFTPRISLFWHFKSTFTSTCYWEKFKRKRSDSVLWQKPLHPQNNPKKQRDNIKTPPKTLITQLLRTDLGRSVGGHFPSGGCISQSERSSYHLDLSQIGWSHDRTILII